MVSASLAELPSALDHLAALLGRLRSGRVVVFLDYDGTLTPIVDDPAAATLPARTRTALARLARCVPVAIVSGRDLADVRGLVGLTELWYAGSHGFDIVGPGSERSEIGLEALGELDAAEADLRAGLARLAGVHVERKRFAVAVHTRRAPDAVLPATETVVAEVAARHPTLRRSGGKRVLELRPGLDWDKGRAVGWLLAVMGSDGSRAVPLYVGDDETDEDAFRALGDQGVGIVVRGEADSRSTAATYALATTDEVADLLERLAAGLGERRTDD